MMCMLKIKRSVVQLPCFAVWLSTLFFTASAPADSLYSVIEKQLWFDKVHRLDATLVPTRLMSDDQLFWSADVYRNANFSQPHLQANHFWLRSQQGDCYEGSAALRKVLHMTFSTMYPSLTFSSEEYLDNRDGRSYREGVFSLKDLENYSLRLSQRRVSLKLKYDF